MATAQRSVSKGYWLTWAILLALTLVMLVTEIFSLPAGLALAVLLLAMLVKASLIGANFMHLRFEKAGLIWAVVLSILALGGIMFWLMAYDALRVGELSGQG